MTFAIRAGQEEYRYPKMKAAVAIDHRTVAASLFTAPVDLRMEAATPSL